MFASNNKNSYLCKVSCKFKKTPLTRKNLIIKIFAGASILVGGILNALMFVFGGYPTYLFFILMLVGLVLFLIGILTRQIKTLYQLGISFFPFIIYFVVNFINLPSSDTFIIPKDFRGTIYVYYDQVNGVEKEFDGSRRIYRIPQDGILLTKFSLKGGVIDLSGSRFYLVDEIGNRIELKHCSVHDENKTKDSTMVQAIYGVCGQSSNYGLYQTIYIDYPTIKFWKEENSMRKEFVHDSIMKIKTNQSRPRL